MAHLEAKFFGKSGINESLINSLVSFVPDLAGKFIAELIKKDARALILSIKIDKELCAISLLQYEEKRGSYELCWEVINPKLSEEKKRQTLLCLRQEYLTAKVIKK